MRRRFGRRSEPGPRIAWGLAGSAFAHAALIAFVWHSAASSVTPRGMPRPSAAISVRLMARAMPAAATQAPVAAAAALTSTQRASRRSPRPVAHAKAATITTAASVPALRRALPDDALAAPAGAPALAATQPVSGAVFAMPRLGFGGATAAGWMARRTALPTPALPSGPGPAAQGRAAHEGSRDQLVLALERQLGQWQPPADSLEGGCALQALQPAQSPPRLDCDSDALAHALSGQVTLLAGLLEAYRSMDPQAAGLSIAYREGRYRVALNLAGEAR